MPLLGHLPLPFMGSLDDSYEEPIMRTVLELINNPDPCSTVLLIVLLTGIGSKMIESCPDLRAWGYRVAAVALVVYGVYGVMTFHPTTADQLVGIVLRGLIAFGVVLGLFWIVFAIQGFIYQHTFKRLRDTMHESAERRAREREEEKRRLERLEADRRAEDERRRQQAAQPLPLPRSERVKQTIDQARSDYETECLVLRAAGLDADELETALLNARTSYLRKLKEATQ